MLVTDVCALCGLPTAVPIGEYAAVTLLLFFGLKAIKDAWDLPSDVAKKGDNSSPELDELAEAEELVKEKVRNPCMANTILPSILQFNCHLYPLTFLSELSSGIKKTFKSSRDYMEVIQPRIFCCKAPLFPVLSRNNLA